MTNRNEKLSLYPRHPHEFFIYIRIPPFSYTFHDGKQTNKSLPKILLIKVSNLRTYESLPLNLSFLFKDGIAKEFVSPRAPHPIAKSQVLIYCFWFNFIFFKFPTSIFRVINERIVIKANIFFGKANDFIFY